MGASGILLVRKPPGPTSHDIVAGVRRTPVAAGAKVGHAGTLDPFAGGLLIVLIGRATRLQRYFMALPKRYRARARFGAVSDTGDPEGDIAETGSVATEADVRAALPRLTGEIEQQVPRASAVKVGGERLYRKARRGEEFATPVRRVTVHELQLVAFDPAGQTGELDVACSSGTYIRQLVTDLGELTGAGAYCEALERTAIGPFAVPDDEEAEEARLIGLDQALPFMPERRLTEAEGHAARHGRRVADAGPEGEVLRLTAGGEL